MKTKTTQFGKTLAICIAMIAVCISTAYGQGNTWKLTGNNNVNGSDFIGPTNAEDFRIKTNDTLRMIVREDGDVEMLKNAKIGGILQVGQGVFSGTGPGITKDFYASDLSILNFGRVTPPIGSPTFFSYFSDIKMGFGLLDPTEMVDIAGRLRVRTIDLDNSLNEVLVRDANGVVYRRDISTFPGGADNDWFNPLTGTAPLNITDDVFTQGDVGIGPFSPTLTPKSPLHLHQPAGFLKMQLTNNATGSGTNDGFQMGIISTFALILQREDAPMVFFTNTIERMRIMNGTGFVGFNVTNPTQNIDIAGNVRIRGLTSGTNTGIVTHETNGTFHTLAFTGNSNDVLLGNGTFGPVVGGADNDWTVNIPLLTTVLTNTTHDVGIGTTTPTAKTEISHSNINSGAFALRITNRGTGSITDFTEAGIAFNNSVNGNPNFFTARIYSVFDGLGVSDGRFSFQLRNGTGVFQDILNITGRRRVGINITNPSHTLDVNGSVRIRQLPATTTITDVVVADNNGILFVNTAFTGGVDGLNCWDTDGDGVCNLLTEDINSDGVCDAIDCQGPVGPIGPQGTAGVAGTDGADGTDGLNCWDINANGTCDFVTEDINNDGVCDVLDCQGIGADADWAFVSGNTINDPIFRNARVGIGTITPNANTNLHVENGSVLFSGTTGTTPIAGIGTRLMWIPSKFAFRAGYVSASAWDDGNIGDFSVAFGANTRASGDGSFAVGNATVASGVGSIAMGNDVIASGPGSVALGLNLIASGPNSTAIGVSTVATGSWSFATGGLTTASGMGSAAFGVATSATGRHSVSTGEFTIAQSRNSCVVGQFNTPLGSPTVDNLTNALFIVGNGADAANRSNAMIVRRDGNVGIGTNSPTASLEVNGVAGNNTGFWSNLSDIQLKTNIQPFTDGLDVIKQINPIFYKYNGLAGKPTVNTYVGIIAQDLLQIAPYTIDTIGVFLNQNDTIETDILRFESGPLWYATINAIKELDSMNSDLVNKVDSLEDELNIINSWRDSVDLMLTSLMDCYNNLPPGLCGNNGNGNKMKNSGSGSGNQKSYTINSVVSIVPDNTLSGKNTKLYQNVPNPFRYRTRFDYSIGEAGDVELVIHTYDGRYITTLVGEHQESGSYSIDWDTTDIAAGIYFYTLKVEGVEWVKKAIRLK